MAVSTAGYFVGPNGRTLYVFDKDTADTSNCQTDPCLTNWPALTVPSGGQITVGSGLSTGDFKTISRTDGSSQVVYKDIPLYYFAGDQATGDTHGDGIGGIWHLAKSSSTLPAASTPSAAASAPASVPASVPASAPATTGGGDQGPCYDAHYQVVPCPSSGAAGSPAAGGSTVAIAAAGYLVGANGLTLYTFDKDTAPGSSACTADCLTNWPALTAENTTDITLGSGLDPEDFTTFTRSDDGTLQVAYYGKPLYFYAGDAAPGQTNGDGLFDIWHTAMPQ